MKTLEEKTEEIQKNVSKLGELIMIEIQKKIAEKDQEKFHDEMVEEMAYLTILHTEKLFKRKLKQLKSDLT